MRKRATTGRADRKRFVFGNVLEHKVRARFALSLRSVYVVWSAQRLGVCSVQVYRPDNKASGVSSSILTHGAALFIPYAKLAAPAPTTQLQTFVFSELILGVTCQLLPPPPMAQDAPQELSELRCSPRCSAKAKKLIGAIMMKVLSL